MKSTGSGAAHYNTKFAKLCIDAFLNGKKTFAFECSRYNTSECMKGVLEDIKNGYYSLKLSIIKENKLK